MNPPAFLYNCGDYVWCNKFGFLLKSVYFFCKNELGTLAKLDSLSLKKNTAHEKIFIFHSRCCRSRSHNRRATTLV